MSKQDINDATGFENGAKFISAEDVYNYFTVEVMVGMFGQCTQTQGELDEMAERVIEKKWHCEF